MWSWFYAFNVPETKRKDIMRKPRKLSHDLRCTSKHFSQFMSKARLGHLSIFIFVTDKNCASKIKVQTEIRNITFIQQNV